MEIVEGKTIFSNSRIQTYLSCPAKYYWEYVRNIVPAQTALALVYGDVVHKMFHVFFTSFSKSGVEKEAYTEAKKELSELYCNANIEHTTKTVETALVFLKDVIGFGLHLHPKVESEVVVITELKSIFSKYQNYLGGTIDLKIVNNDGSVSLFDFKTISRLDSTYYIKQEMNRQFKTYAWLANTNNLSIIPLHCIKKPVAYAPYIFEFTKECISQWFLETSAIISSILSIPITEKPAVTFPKSCTDCTGTFGCSYLELCKQGRLDKVIPGDNFVARKERYEG